MQTRDRSSTIRASIAWAAGVSVIATFLAGSGAARAQVKSSDVTTILESMRRAADQPDSKGRPAEILIEGKADRSGLTSDYTLRFTTGSREMFLQIIAGPLPGEIGFNGKECWSTDLSGMPLRSELRDLDRNRLLLALETGQWLAHADAKTVTLAKAKPARDEVVLEIKQGRLKGELRVSRATWLPKSLKRSGSSDDNMWTFTDYRGFAGLKLPGTVTINTPGETEIYRVGSIQPAPQAPASVYDIVARPDDTRFDAAAGPGVVARRATTGHLLVQPRIDGREIGWFIFDTTAAANLIDPKTAAMLKLERLGSAAVSSMMGTEQSSILRAGSLVLGPMTMAKPLFVTMDLGAIQKMMGNDVVGIVGYDVLARCVAEVTLADYQVKLYDPKEYHLESPLWQPLAFNQAVPAVPATYEGNRTGLFRIGAGTSGQGGMSNVVFHAPVVQEKHLLKNRPVDRMQMGTSVLGFGKVAWFKLAGHRFKNPDAVFAIETQAAFGDEYVDGNIGVDFLKPFRMVLDFPHSRVAFLPLTERKR
jgi:hypothetical protein